jgi:hypothetical protein
MDPNLLSGLMGLIGSLVGAAAGYFGATRAADKSYMHQTNLEEERSKTELLSLLQAIHDEIEIQWDIYEDYGKVLDNLADGEAVMMQSPIGVNFTIYLTNCHRIGQIEDHDLRKLIITTYARAIEQVTCVQENNRMLINLDIIRSAQNVGTWGQEKEQQEQLNYYGGVMKKNHLELKKLKTELLRSLHKRGVLSDVSNQRLLTK